MKAIVLAGGEGTRLRPITAGRPKPMAELFGKPILEHTVELLKRHGFTDIMFTLRYMPETIQEHFGDGSRFGVNISYMVEREPLGTAGGVRACSGFWDDDGVLVVSGDAVCDFDLMSLWNEHKRTGAHATIALYRHPDPTAFGLVITDKDGRVIRFSEKPDWENVVTDRVNAGIYCLTKKAIELIPPGVMYDFGKELFPTMLRENKLLQGILMDGYWCDVGSPEAYRSCCMDILTGQVKGMPAGERSENGVFSLSHIPDGAMITPPVYIGENCTVEPGAIIENCVIAPGSTVRSGALVEGSVINGAELGSGTRTQNAVIGRGAALGSGTRVKQGCVIGDGAATGADCVIEADVRIWPNITIPDGTTVRQTITTAWEAAESGDGTGAVQIAEAFSIGAELGKTGQTGVAFTGGELARLIGTAIMCGVNSAGSDAVLLDSPFESALGWSCGAYGLSGGVFVRQTGDKVGFTLLSQDGRRLRRSVSRHTAVLENHAANAGTVSLFTGTEVAYRAWLRQQKRCENHNAAFSVSGKGAANRALKKALSSAGFEVKEPGEGVADFSVDETGFILAVRGKDSHQLTNEEVQAVLVSAAARCGYSSVAVPRDAVGSLETMAARLGIALIREERTGTEKLIARQRFYEDGLCAAVLIASAVSIAGDMESLLQDAPPVRVRKGEVPVNGSRALAMEMIAAACSEMSAEFGSELLLRSAAGLARIHPDGEKNALSVCCEAESEEAAWALSEDIARRLNDIS